MDIDRELNNLKTTIVTCLFDIGRDKWDNFTMSYDAYLSYMKNMLSIDQYMNIYTEEKFFKPIFEMRSEVDPKMKKTKIRIVTLENSHCDKLWGTRIRRVMASEEFKQGIAFPDVPEMCKPWYNILMYSKIYWMNLAINSDYFQTDNFMWLDSGIFRELGNNTHKQYNIQWPVKQLQKPTFFCHHDTVRITNEKQHSLSQMRFIHGGCFVIPKKYFQDFKDDFEDTLDNMLKNNYVGSDEKLLDLVFLKNTDKFDLIVSDWREYFTHLL